MGEIGRTFLMAKRFAFGTHQRSQKISKRVCTFFWEVNNMLQLF